MAIRLMSRGACCALIGGAVFAVQPLAAPSAYSQEKDCPASEADIMLPKGFCATVFADKVGHARQAVVAPDGTLYLNTWSGVYYNNDTPHEGGFLVALKDTKGTGSADVVSRFGPTFADGGHGGTGIALYKNWLYAEINDQIVRYDVSKGAPAADAKPEIILSGMPITVMSSRSSEGWRGRVES